MKQQIRAAAVAGTFYGADADMLRRQYCGLRRNFLERD